MSGEPNLRVLRPSRKRLRPGDIFTLSPAPKLYLFGRIISLDAVGFAPGLPGCVLIYVYDAKRETPSLPSDDELTPRSLLVPPIMTNRLAWSRGYFETIAHRPLTSNDRLEVYCFREFATGGYVDEYNHELPGPIEPVGDAGLHSYGSISDLVCEALGIPLAPD